MNRNIFWIICWIISILFAITIILIPFFYIYFATDFESKKQLGELLREYAAQGLFRFGALISFVFWIYSIFIWNRRKDSIFNLLLLVFINVLYAPIYYIREIKSRNKIIEPFPEEKE